MSNERDVDEDRWVSIDYSSTHVSNGNFETPDSEVPTQDDGRGSAKTGIDESTDMDATLERADTSDVGKRWQWILNIRNSYTSKWEWFSDLNQGVGEQSRSTDNHHADVGRCVDTLCSRLDCTDRTKKRVHWLVKRFDMKDLHSNAPYEAIVLATITMVANERVDGKHSVRFIRQEDAFDELLSSLDVSRDTIRTIRQSIRESDTYRDTS